MTIIFIHFDCNKLFLGFLQYIYFYIDYMSLSQNLIMLFKIDKIIMNNKFFNFISIDPCS